MATGEGFYLGGVVDPETRKPTGERVSYEPSDLTTHGVIVGMTGSGKTGLGIIFLEEALRSGIPALILDPKGDMTNLLLTFPGLTPEEFRPWVDELAARRDGKTPDQAAADAAATWAKGLEASGLSPADIAALRAAAEFTVYTPGSTSGVSLDILGSLAAPAAGADPEAYRDQIEALVTGILHLAGIDADPLASREHILLANLVEDAWEDGSDLTFEALVGLVHRPPLRKLGVFDLDTFFPEKDRLALAMRLNNLLASPSFEAWRTGPPLDLPSMLWTAEGKPRAAVVYLAHLSDDERQFAVGLILSGLVTWMRSQPGSSDLRALVYMDEVFGFVPPSAMPPAKKPILTLLKQARAFGVGMLLSTQNPMDLDYKAMSNAGTWCIGLLQTERDKARILEALASAAGGRDLGRLDTLISGLGKRQFLLHNTREKQPVLFGTRFAMSYMRGPLTLQEIAGLTADDPRREEAGAPAAAEAAPVLGEDEMAATPRLASGVPVYYLDPGAPWAQEVGARRGGTRLEAALAVRAHLTFRDATAGLHDTEEWEAIFHPLTAQFDPAAAVTVDYDARDFRTEGPAGATYQLPAADLSKKTYFTAAGRALKDHLTRARSREVQRNRSLKLYSRAGETPAQFASRCAAAARDAADVEAAKIRDRFEGRLRDLRRDIEEARLEADQAAREQEAQVGSLWEPAVGVLVDILFKGRGSGRRSTSTASRTAAIRRARDRRERAETDLTGKVGKLEDLEGDLADELAQIDSAWEAKAAEVETIKIPLSKANVTVDEVAVVWLPMG